MYLEWSSYNEDFTIELSVNGESHRDCKKLIINHRKLAMNSRLNLSPPLLSLVLSTNLSTWWMEYCSSSIMRFFLFWSTVTLETKVWHSNWKGVSLYDCRSLKWLSVKYLSMFEFQFCSFSLDEDENFEMISGEQ